MYRFMFILSIPLGFSDIQTALVSTDVENYSGFMSFTLTDVITLIGIALTFIAVLFNTYQSRITNNRIQWIQSIRELGAKIVAFDHTNADIEKLVMS